MERVKIQDRGIIELPKKLLDKFKLEKGVEFDLFYDSETLYLKRVFKSLKDISFKEIAQPFREMAKKENLNSDHVIKKIKEFRMKGKSK